ncbi:YraN family protein, partial [bacterium]|nr:YraN family protein [bacterium]
MSPHPRAIEPEDAAARFLKRQGLKVVERNFNTTLGEIDIVAVDGDVLVFVEVRTCSSWARKSSRLNDTSLSFFWNWAACSWS